jgi:DivIVA protein
MGASAANSHLFDTLARSHAMSYFRRSDETLPGSPEDGTRFTEHEVRSSADAASPTSSRWGGFGEKLVKVFTVQEADEEEAPVNEAGDETVEHDVLAEVESQDSDSGGRFPVGPFGYNRTAVDQYVGELERELEDLRRDRPAPPVSINEEIERLGEQTASILVVAHDQANETTRRAQEQADRCIADAAANAVAMTAQAKQQLRELDSETDAVWQERQRLIDDVRCTAAALISLADEATERFPEDDKPTIDAPVRFAE